MRLAALFTFIFITTAWSQDLVQSLTDSFRVLDAVSNGPQVACFDYARPNSPVLATEKINGCPNPYTQVPVGRYRKMTRQGYKSGNYLLSRPSANKYQAILNLDFQTGGPHGTGTAELTANMLQRTRNCLREMAPFMKGPNNEQFEIVVVTPTDNLPEGMDRPRAVPIKVTQQDATYRGDAGNFGSNFQCTTIGHEVLHHLGLCDEYHEGIYKPQSGANVDWSCRAVTTEPSYMRNMRFAYDQIIPQTSRCVCDSKCQLIMANPAAAKIFTSMNANHLLATESSLTDQNNAENPDRNRCSFKRWENVPAGTVPDKAFKLGSRNGNIYEFHSYEVKVNSSNTIYYDKAIWECNCPTGHPYCDRMMTQLQEREREAPKMVQCPRGTTSKSEAPSIGADLQGNRVTDCTGEGAARVCELVITNPGNGKSLLHPTQFNKILAGNCRGGSPAYEQCENYSYMGAGESCNAKPAECNSDDFLLRGILPAAAQ